MAVCALNNGQFLRCVPRRFVNQIIHSEWRAANPFWSGSESSAMALDGPTLLSPSSHVLLIFAAVIIIEVLSRVFTQWIKTNDVRPEFAHAPHTPEPLHSCTSFDDFPRAPRTWAAVYSRAPSAAHAHELTARRSRAPQQSRDFRGLLETAASALQARDRGESSGRCSARPAHNCPARSAAISTGHSGKYR